MNLLDIIVVAFIFFGGFKGYQKGLLITLIGFLSLYISVIVSFKYFFFLSFFISKIANNIDQNSLNVISIVLTIILVYLLLVQISKFIKYILNLTFIGFIDDIGGALIGCVIVSFLISFSFNIVDWLNIEIFLNQMEDSILYPIIKEISPTMIKYIFLFIELSPEGWDLLENLEKTETYSIIEY